MVELRLGLICVKRDSKLPGYAIPCLQMALRQEAACTMIYPRAVHATLSVGLLQIFGND